MSEGNSQKSGGIGFLGLLALLFIALRLTGYIDWPWWAVLAPMWGPFAAILAVALFLIVLGTIINALKIGQHRQETGPLGQKGRIFMADMSSKPFWYRPSNQTGTTSGYYSADNGKKARDDVESSLKGFSKWLEEHAEELASMISDDFSYWGVGISQDLTIGDGGSAPKVGINIRNGQNTYSSAFYLRD